MHILLITHINNINSGTFLIFQNFKVSLISEDILHVWYFNPNIPEAQMLQNRYIHILPFTFYALSI